MKIKALVYFSIVFLLSGISLKIIGIFPMLASVLIYLGAAGKLCFVVLKILRKEYRIGYEMLFLAIGLTFFFIGLYKPFSFIGNNIGLILISIGILLKISFVIIFVKKLRKALR